MSKINAIQNAICELEGGSFQKLFDAYLYKKYKLTNIQTLGVQAGTNKTTKGTPDSFVLNENGKYTLIMYGSVKTEAFIKIKRDILSCFEEDKLKLKKDEIEKIICAYSSTNIHIEQIKELTNMITDVEIEMVGLSTISHDLLVNYPFLAAEYLHIPIDTEQIYSIHDFINSYDKNGMNSPLDMSFLCREKELENLYYSINNSEITLVTGVSGVGKTKLVLEVCERFEKEEWNALCVKNNGELLYNDIKYYISDPGKYILFIDDANQTTSLEYILDYVKQLSRDITVKIVMTVRDYAKYRIKSIVCKYNFPSEIIIKLLKNDEIKLILKSNLGIMNRDYLDRIAEITKGNIRLAILAGKISMEKGYVAIRNATDIFENYYGAIILNSELTEKEVNSLFVISLLGPFRFKDSVISLKILEKIGINSEEFISICHGLNSKEMIDLYQDEVVKISDQSFGNYMLKYALIDKRILSISELLKLGFPKFKNKLVYALNTIMKLFYSEELEKYIADQVNLSWNSANEVDQWEYLKVFHSLNEEKSLAVLKSRIDDMDIVNKNLMEFDLENKKNNKNITSDEINILISFKYSEYYIDVLDLMILFFEKRPDLVMDFYFAFSDNLSFDVNSYQLNYKKEYELVESIWKHSDEGKNVNVTILLLNILKEFMKCSFSRAESGESFRSINFIQINIILNDGSKKLRLLIWSILSKLYEYRQYEEIVEGLIMESYISGLKEDEAKRICEFDLKCIKEIFLNKWSEPTFNQCKVISQIEKHSYWLGIENIELFRRYAANKDFMIYNTLIKEHIKGRTWQEDEAEREKEIASMIKDFQECDYKNMFEICRMREKENDKEDWGLQSGIDIVFSILEINLQKYSKVIEIYLLSGAPYGYRPEKIINYLVKENGFEKTIKLINGIEFNYKHIWLGILWIIIPKEKINHEIVNNFLNVIKNEVKLDNSKIPYVGDLEKYKIVSNDFIKDVSEILLQASQEKQYIVADYLGHHMEENEVELLERLFDNNMNLLERLYFRAIGNYFDYEGRLLIKLVRRNINFWNEFTLNIEGNIDNISYEDNIFESIWNMENYSKLIDIAFENMIKESYYFIREREGIAIFSNSKKSSECVKERKKLWICEYIQKYCNNKTEIKKIFGIIATVFPGERIEYLMEMLKYSRCIELFKVIPLFPASASRSGSEVPLIDKKIDFLKELLNSLKGIEYIEHRAYIKERKDRLEDYKMDVIIREYLENNDIA